MTTPAGGEREGRAPRRPSVDGVWLVPAGIVLVLGLVVWWAFSDACTREGSWGCVLVGQLGAILLAPVALVLALVLLLAATTPTPRRPAAPRDGTPARRSGPPTPSGAPDAVPVPAVAADRCRRDGCAQPVAARLVVAGGTAARALCAGHALEDLATSLRIIGQGPMPVADFDGRTTDLSGPVARVELALAPGGAGRCARCGQPWAGGYREMWLQGGAVVCPSCRGGA